MGPPIAFAPRTLAIVGTGLLGTSLGLALGRLEPGIHRIGIGRRLEPLKVAHQRQAIDEFNTDLAGALAADWIVLAMPLASTGRVLCDLARGLEAGTRSGPGLVVMDLGSTKRDVLLQADRWLGELAGVYFVGCHPMAGGERQGPEAADGMLFAGKPLIITPNASTDARAKAEVVRFWEALGMRTLEMDAAEHDELVARVSHLPHIAAAAVAGLADFGRAAEVASTGFADMTRLAMGDSRIWTEILLSNRDKVLEAIEAVNHSIEGLREALENGNAGEVSRWLDEARSVRQAFDGLRGGGQSA
ncbi:MAG: prephenate dehydrogenase/arogenate dehydrogenase family protein [Phycisphaeraceae bacterium]|nr:prephenate dehydrogenase/arogenate dehydrogenase family protein [Phycisphaeraceae bacterium]